MGNGLHLDAVTVRGRMTPVRAAEVDQLERLRSPFRRS